MLRIFLLITLIFFHCSIFARSSVDQPISHESYKEDASEFEPWFTGPLLAPAAVVVPVGHTNWEPYLYVTDNIGIYDHHWKHVTKGKSVTVNPLLDVTHGLTKWMDIQIITPLIWNFKDKQNDLRYGDTTIYFGFQVLRDKRNTWWPDLRITVQESFPSGHYEYFDPKKKGTDNSGNGSFQTGFSFNFQKLFYLHPRLLRVRFNAAYMFPSVVHVHSFNAYGGGFSTNGKVHPGGKFSTILAFEYTITQQLCAALDIQYIWDAKRKFNGNPGILRDGEVPSLKGPPQDQLSLAPALEYNFSGNIGIVAGVWFSVLGKQSRDFISGVFAVNIYR